MNPKKDCEKSNKAKYKSESFHKVSYSLPRDIQNSNESEKFHMRLNSFIAKSGVCSRRKADDLIKTGRISINGVIQLNPGQKVNREDRVKLDGRPLKCEEKLIYLMLHKPIHSVSTVSDPQGRRTVIDLLPEKYSKFRLYPVGRLDYFSEGLLLLTNDGELANALMHPSHGIAKTYEVTIAGAVPDGALKLMASGMRLEDGTKLAPVKIRSEYVSNGNTRLYMELRQGINRQIRRMCEQTGLTILRLKRISEGRLRLGQLPQGQVRELSPQEIAHLYREAGLNEK